MNLQGQALVTDQLAAAVIQVASRQRESLLAGHFATLVVHLGQVFQHQQWAIDQPAHVAQLAVVKVQIELGVAEQLAALLIQPGEWRSGFAAGDTSAVVHLGGGQLKRSALVIRPLLFSVPVARVSAPRLLSRPLGPLSRLALVRSRLASVSMMPPWLLIAPLAASMSACAEEIAPALLLSVAPANCRVPSLLIVPSWLSSRPSSSVPGMATSDMLSACWPAKVPWPLSRRAVEAVVLGENHPLGLVDHMGHGQLQCGTGDQFARAVIQALRLEVDAAAAGNLARTVINGVDRQFQRFCGAYQAALAIVRRCR